MFCWIVVAAATLVHSEAAPDAAAILSRAREVMGMNRARGRVLHYKAIASAEQAYQSDRSYPPFFSTMSDQEVWFDVDSSVLRLESCSMFPGTGPLPPSVTIDDGTNAIVQRGSQAVAIARRQATARALSAWAAVADWSAAAHVWVAPNAIYRDYPRQVLVRRTADGEQQLYVDPKTGFPVKLELIEPHYLWGQRHVEYVWSNWTTTGEVAAPGAAFRLADGAVELSQTCGTIDLVASPSTPSLARPAAPSTSPEPVPLFLQPLAPTLTKVSDHVSLLSNPGYTEAVAQIGEDIYVLDATQGDERARHDAEAIARLFPGAHRINVVVTDLAWPHIAGVRYWVSRGATIIAHAAAREFLQTVVDRRWTFNPDTLERERARRKVPMKFVAVDGRRDVSSGELQIAAIDGIGSEVAVIAYVRSDRFLWASDYIQTVSEPTMYASDVIRTAERAGFLPEYTATQHLPLTEWLAVVAAQQPTSARKR